MRFMGAIVGGIVGGLIGALIWAAIAYYANAEIGYVAIGVGVLVGIGARVGARSEDGFAFGAVAAIIALASIAGGKFLAVRWMAGDALKTQAASFQMTDEMLTTVVAHQLVEEYKGAGKTVKWPNGVTPENAEKPGDFPTDLWTDASGRVAKMTDAQKKDYEAFVKDRFASAMSTAQTEAAASVYTKTFSPWDILWGLLALGASFKIASGDADLEG